MHTAYYVGDIFAPFSFASMCLNESRCCWNHANCCEALLHFSCIVNHQLTCWEMVRGKKPSLPWYIHKCTIISLTRAFLEYFFHTVSVQLFFICGRGARCLSSREVFCCWDITFSQITIFCQMKNELHPLTYASTMSIIFRLFPGQEPTITPICIMGNI